MVGDEDLQEAAWPLWRVYYEYEMPLGASASVMVEVTITRRAPTAEVAIEASRQAGLMEVVREPMRSSLRLRSVTRVD